MLDKIRRLFKVNSPSLITFCDHDWKKIKLVREYYDYSGFKVGVFECECSKCGLSQIRKYY